MEKFTNLCKKWCFQLERGSETGYLHYQARVTLINRTRPERAQKIWFELLPGCHVTPTSTKVYTTKDEYYVMKEDTRVEGPWTDQDVDLSNIVDPKSLPSDLLKEDQLFTWQRQIIETFKSQDIRWKNRRKINVLIDLKGNIGKSALSLYCRIHKIAFTVPPQREDRDIIRCVMNVNKRFIFSKRITNYIFDIPRAASCKELNSLYCGMENIKNGYLYDDRYEYKELEIDVNTIWVFTNSVPPRDKLSEDRWDFYYINDKLELAPYDPKHSRNLLRSLKDYNDAMTKRCFAIADDDEYLWWRHNTEEGKNMSKIVDFVPSSEIKNTSPEDNFIENNIIKDTVKTTDLIVPNEPVVTEEVIPVPVKRKITITSKASLRRPMAIKAQTPHG
jgi:hypothetical protein